MYNDSVSEKKLNFYLLRKFFPISITLFLLLACWALITPPGGSADDYYHLPSIWCSDKIDSHSSCIIEKGKFYTPSPISYENVTCWTARNGLQDNSFKSPSSCISEFNSKTFGFSPYLNQEKHLYPIGFYAVSSLFVFHSFEISVLMIRLFWALVFSIIFTDIYLSISRNLRSFFLFFSTILLIPLGASIIPSTNPSSGAFIGLFALPFYFCNYFTSIKKTHLNFFKLLIVSLIAGFSRADAALICILALVIGVLLWRKQVTNNKFFSMVFIAALMSISFINSIQTRTLIKDGLTSRNHANEFIGLDLFAKNVAQQFEYFSGFWGYYWGLGWKFEPPIPLLIPLILAAIFLFYFVVLSRAISGRISKLLILGYAYLSVFVPIMVLTYSNQLVGAVVQPRYGYPFLISGFGFMFLKLDIVKVEQIRLNYLNLIRFKISLLIWQVSASFIYLLQLSRVTNGLPIRYKAQPEWWWSFIPFSPNLIFTIFLLINALIFRYMVKIYKEYVNS